ncbi:MAG TPA: hypothetical protein PKU80_10125 [Candidatus Limiplasma sp.]|nr:hypothetical protein [Candidatus Limiplasma sp.]HRX07814.1 hypothetical protein [Candidatus Limiplasma sp.]
MKYYNEFSDERLKGNCVYCDALPNTVDHIPAKVFLNKPYPENLYVVPACEECNNKYSKDEQFVAFLIDYLVMLDATNTEELLGKIESRYTNWAFMEARILDRLTKHTNGQVSIELENKRIENVIQKFALCHIQYETGTKAYSAPSYLTYSFIPQMSPQEYYEFNNPVSDTILPEIGCRLFQRIYDNGDNFWIIIQGGSYRYYVNAGSSVFVRIVIKEMLFCEVVWNAL